VVFAGRRAAVVLSIASLALGLSVEGLSPATAGSSPPTACADGLGRTVAPTRVRRDAAGGAFFDYDVDGVAVTSAEPPPSLDLTTADPATLERYGLPARPDGEGEDAWLAAMRAFRSTANEPDHSLCLRDDLKGRRRSTLEAQCTASSDNCSNFAGRSATLGSYTAVSANVVVPAMAVSGNCGSEGHISTWVGIGTEMGTDGLLQAGTITRLFPGLAVYTYAFYEWVGPYTVSPIMSTWNALPGHTMYERVTVNTSSHGVNFYVENVTTGQHLTATVAGIYSDYDPDSAGWIVENHTSDNESNVKTGPWTWTNALVTRYSTTTYGGSTQSTEATFGIEQWPTAYYNEVIESPSAWTSTTSFPTSWLKCRGSG